MAQVTTEGNDKNLTSDLSASLNAGDSLSIGSGEVDYDAGADLSGTDLLTVVLAPGFKGNPSATLKFVVNQTGTGNLYNNWGGSTIRIASSGPTGVIHKIHHEPLAGGSAIYENADVEVFKATSGTASLESTLDTNYIIAQGGSTVYAVAAAYTAAEARSADHALLVIDRDVTLLVCGSSVPTLVQSPGVTPATLEVLPGCECDYRGGNIGTLIMHPGGVLNLVNSDRPLTVTDLQKRGDCVVKVKKNGFGQPTYSGTSVNRGTLAVEEVA